MIELTQQELDEIMSLEGKFPPVTKMTLDTDNTLHGTWTIKDEDFNGQMFTVGMAVEIEPNITFSVPQGEVLRIEKDGRIFWRGREVESDDEFRAALMDLHDMMVASMGGWR